LPIQQFLELKEPLKPFFGAMQKLRHIANTAFKGSAQEATARRDELLLGFLVSNPLRDKNIKTLTYKSNNSGDVYQTTAGQWRIKLVGSKQKARKRLGGKPYNVPVAAWLQDLMTAYVREFRPILAKGMSANYFFLSQNGTRFNSLNQQVFKRTRTLIPGCDGINPHAFRHLVATDWLTKFPNDFLTVAELLNDTIEVVMSSYAHLKKEVAFNRYEAYVQKQLPASMF
jgi:integrase